MIHGFINITCHHQCQCGTGMRDALVNLCSFRGGKIRQYPCGKVIIRTGLFTYAELDAGKGVLPGVVDDAFDTVVPAVAALPADSEQARLERDVIE